MKIDNTLRDALKEELTKIFVTDSGNNTHCLSKLTLIESVQLTTSGVEVSAVFDETKTVVHATIDVASQLFTASAILQLPDFTISSNAQVFLLEGEFSLGVAMGSKTMGEELEKALSSSEERSTVERPMNKNLN